MNEYIFLNTHDGSTGLFSEKADDILHSKTGALKEAFDKFVHPIKEVFQKKNNFKILDLCTGVGYNLKASLFFLKNKTAKIDCIDINSDYIFLSPLIKDCVKDINIKLLILYQIIRNGFSIDNIQSVIFNSYNRGFDNFFAPDIVSFINFLFLNGYKNISDIQNLSFLHNIYYNYISDSMKHGLNYNEYSKINIIYKIGDARKLLQNTSDGYDIVFLDAFSPQKDPTLWTIDFLKQLSLNMKKNSVLLSYSKSSPFRSALLELNFFVGKTYINNFDMGTIASFNSSFINNFLSEYDLKILQSKSGIFYKDPNLSLASSEIILNRELEQKNSTRQSRTSLSKLP